MTTLEIIEYLKALAQLKSAGYHVTAEMQQALKCLSEKLD